MLAGDNVFDLESNDRLVLLTQMTVFAPFAGAFPDEVAV
jgi:hypothetical protein